MPNTANDLTRDRAKEEKDVRAVISTYLDAVRTWNEPVLRNTFHPAANVSHYFVKGDEIKTIDLDAFMKVIGSLHAKYENAEEVAKEIEVRFVGPLASVRVAFAFVMGPRTMEGEDLFNFAHCNGEWKIVHKTYWL